MRISYWSSDVCSSDLLAREAFAGAPVAQFMTRDPVTGDPALPLRLLVDDYFYRYRHKLFPVLGAGGTPLGAVRTEHVTAVARDDWVRLAVGDVMEPIGDDKTIDLDADAFDALARMRETGRSRLLVVERWALAGTRSSKKTMEFL